MSGYFADEYNKKEIPPRDTWWDKNVLELMEIRSMLYETQDFFRKQKQFYAMIQSNIDYINDLISQKNQR